MNMMGSFIPANGWTPENEATLTRMWLDGKSTRDIAEAIGDWCNRNKVIGKAHRLGLPPHINPGNRRLGINGRPRTPAQPRKARRAPGRPRATVIAAAEAPVAHVGPGLIIPMLEYNHCRHIAGEPTHDALYCGAPVRPGSSYCAHHHHICWVPYRRRAA